jgi:hypothetical protein
LQLRFSAIGRAAWGRFVPGPILEHFQRDYHVEVLIEMRRGSDRHLNSWLCDYPGEAIWSSLLVVGPVPVGASVTVYFDRWLVGQAHTQVVSERGGAGARPLAGGHSQ